MDKEEVLKWLERKGTRRTVEGMARYGIVAKRAFGVPMGTLLLLRKRLGKDHALSLALWESGWYEARLLAALVGDPLRVTRRQMNAWAASFENWADCDTAASISSTGRRSRGRRPASGRPRLVSSSSAPLSR